MEKDSKIAGKIKARITRFAHRMAQVRKRPHRKFMVQMLYGIQAIFYFASAELGRKLKLNILPKRVYEKAKRFFEVPDFKQYAIADGIYRILFGHRAGLRQEPLRSHRQLFFPFARFDGRILREVQEKRGIDRMGPLC